MSVFEVSGPCPPLGLLAGVVAEGSREFLVLILLVELAGLIALLVVYFTDALFFQVSAVNGFCVVVGNVCRFCRAGNRVLLLVNEADKLASLLVGHLDILAHHEESDLSLRLNYL